MSMTYQMFLFSVTDTADILICVCATYRWSWVKKVCAHYKKSGCNDKLVRTQWDLINRLVQLKILTAILCRILRVIFWYFIHPDPFMIAHTAAKKLAMLITYKQKRSLWNASVPLLYCLCCQLMSLQATKTGP